MTLKEARNLKELTQTEAAEFLGISLRTYKRFENEKEYQKGAKYNLMIKELSEYKRRKKYTRKEPNLNVTFRIYGAGYVGYATGMLLAKKCKVCYFDIDHEKLEKILENEHIYVQKAGKYTDFPLDNAVICLPTNLSDDGKSFDMSGIRKLVLEIASENNSANIIIKSTLPVGYVEELETLVSNPIMYIPEFLRENFALKDSTHPSRLIIGSNHIDENVKKIAAIFSQNFETYCDVFFMSSREAEITKLYSNSYLAMRVAFFNELDSYASEHGLDTDNIIKGITADPRIGKLYSDPGFCYSGYCLPKDTIVASEMTNNNLIKEVIESNEARKRAIVKDIINEAKKRKSNPLIGFYNINLESTRQDANKEIYNLLKNENIEVFIGKNTENIGDFAEKSDLIVVDRIPQELKKYQHKIYSRDRKMKRMA